jgi:VanZ family protein
MIKALVSPLLFMTIIFVLSSIPGRPENGSLKFIVDIDPQLQNFLHIPLFGMLQILWLKALATMGMLGWKNVATCLVISLIYGVSDEFHQMFVPGRYASLTDLLLNLTGVIFGTFVFLWFNRKNISNTVI